MTGNIQQKFMPKVVQNFYIKNIIGVKLPASCLEVAGEFEKKGDGDVKETSSEKAYDTERKI